MKNTSYLGEILDQDNHLLATAEVDLNIGQDRGLFVLRSVCQDCTGILHTLAAYLDSVDNGRLKFRELVPCSERRGEYHFSFDRLS